MRYHAMPCNIMEYITCEGHLHKADVATRLSSSRSEWIHWKWFKNYSANLKCRRTHPFKSQKEKEIHPHTKTIFIVVFIINQEWWAAGEKVRQAVLYNLRGWEEGKGMGGLALGGWGLAPGLDQAPLSWMKAKPMRWSGCILYPKSFYM